MTDSLFPDETAEDSLTADLFGEDAPAAPPAAPREPAPEDAPPAKPRARKVTSSLEPEVSPPPAPPPQPGGPSYVVLARKYRPQTFSEIVGQDSIRSAISQAIESGRVGHAYLFAGPRGTGKTSTARILAKALNCLEGGPRPDPCGRCKSCLEVAASSNLDVIEIDAASNTGVDNIRDLRSGVLLSPFYRFKVYIVDEVHMLSTQAFNALLKTLEEPPSQVVFILATTDVHKVPETIVSRCQRFDFRRFSTAEIAAQLGFILDRELEQRTLKIEPEERAGILELLARHAEGGMRDAQVALDQVLVLGRDRITCADVLRFLGAAGPDALDRFARALAARDTDALLLQVDELSAAGQDLERFVRECAHFLRDLLILASVREPAGLVTGAADRVEQMRAFAHEAGVPFLLNAAATMLRLGDDMRTSAHPRYVLEIAVVRLSQIDLLEELSALTDALGSGGASGGGGATATAAAPAPKPAPAPLPSARPAPAEYAAVDADTGVSEAPAAAEIPAPKPVPPPVSAQPPALAPVAAAVQPPPAMAQRMLSAASPGSHTPESVANYLLEKVAHVNQYLYMTLKDTTVVSAENGVLTLSVHETERFNYDHLRRPANEEMLRTLMRDLTGEPYALRVVTVPAPGAPPAMQQQALPPSPEIVEAASPEQEPEPEPDVPESDEALEMPSETVDNHPEPQQFCASETLRGSKLEKFLDGVPEWRAVVDRIRSVLPVDDGQIAFRTHGL